MNFLLWAYKLLPRRLKKRLKQNSIAQRLHGYTVLRPIYKNSIIKGITIELTDRCNLRCSYCPKSVLKYSQGGNINFDLFKSVVNEACKLVQIKQICLVGFGEPLLYPHLEEAIRLIKENYPAIHVTITTNGVVLNSEWAYRFHRVGLDQITISINAISKEQYKEINRADLYDKVVQNTISFLETLNTLHSPLRVYIQVLKGINGPKEIRLFRSFWEPKLGLCGEIQEQPFVNWGGIIQFPQNNSSLNKRKEDPYPCAHIQSSWIITREGDALACCMVFPGDEEDLVLGNVKEKSLKELYMEGKILELRKRNLEGTLYELLPCKYCDAYKTVPNVWIKNPFYPFFGRKWL